MTYTKIAEINCETGETVIREMTASERQDYDVRAAAQKQDAIGAAKAAIDKESATAKLAALGLTTDDLKALGLGGN